MYVTSFNSESLMPVWILLKFLIILITSSISLVVTVFTSCSYFTSCSFLLFVNTWIRSFNTLLGLRWLLIRGFLVMGDVFSFSNQWHCLRSSNDMIWDWLCRGAYVWGRATEDIKKIKNKILIIKTDPDEDRTLVFVMKYKEVYH